MLTDSTYIYLDHGADSIAVACDSVSQPVGVAIEAVDTVEAAVPAWVSGMQPSTLPGHSVDLSWIALVVVVAVALMASRAGVVAHTLGAMWQAATAGKPSRDVYRDEHISDALTQTALWPLTIISCAVALWAVSDAATAASLGWMAILAAAYYAVQWIAYGVGAWTFAPDGGAVEWLRGLTSTQCLAGLCMVVPAMVVLFYPGASLWLGWAALDIWLAWRILFIIKGFRIFYGGVFTLFYFILYLCTLEIAPLVVLYGLVEGQAV